MTIYAGRSSTFICESADTDGTYSLPWGDENAYKIADIPVTGNKTYSFTAALYSPWYEDSGLSEVYYADVTEITVPAVDKDPDPYPHPTGNILTDTIYLGCNDRAENYIEIDEVQTFEETEEN